MRTAIPSLAKQGIGNVLNPSGYSVINEPGARAKEHDTFTCGHCGFITFTQPRVNGPLMLAVIQFDQSITMREVHRCRKCFRHVCPKCENNLFSCTPYEAKIEAEEALARKALIT